MIKNLQAVADVTKTDRSVVYELTVSGKLKGYKTTAARMHMLLSFVQDIDGQKKKQRYYPMFVECTMTKEEDCKFIGTSKVELAYVFADKKGLQPDRNVSVSLCYVDQNMQWQEIEVSRDLRGEQLFDLYQQPRVLIRIAKLASFGLCTVLLPVWLCSGWLASKGIGKLSPRAQKASGKKAIFYHANDMVKAWTGYDYSVRDHKTRYFARQYARAVKQIATPEGVLFLSERQVDAGGNLDRVRSLLQEEGKTELKEFLTTKTVDKLTLGELKKSAYLAAGAKVIVLEDFVPQLGALNVRQETEVLQLWHACGAFKLFGLSELGLTDLAQNTRNHRTYTRAIVSGSAMAPFYSEAFGMHINNIRQTGIPRTDVFFDGEYRKETVAALYERYPQWKDKKIMLFAPTFRGSGNKTAFYPMERFPIVLVMNALPPDTVLLVKQHPFVHSDLSMYRECDFADRLFDLTGKENINDLLFITDLLVTDYSSSIFEAALIDIPMIFYAFDLEEYLRERDLYFDFAEFVPGEIVEDLQTLISRMKEVLISPAKTSVDDSFRQFFLGLLDGSSTRRTTDLIYDMLDGTDQPTYIN